MAEYNTGFIIADVIQLLFTNAIIIGYNYIGPLIYDIYSNRTLTI